MTAIQFIEPTDTEAEAKTIFASLGGQVGYLGGRILPPSKRGWSEPPRESWKPAWRVQAFFTADDVPAGTWLPDGCRHVLIPDSQRKALGILEVVNET